MRTAKGTDVPDDLAAALSDAGALRVFERMSLSCQREYVRWVTDAKRNETRTRRVAGVLSRIHDYGVRHGWLEAAPALDVS